MGPSRWCLGLMAAAMLIGGVAQAASPASLDATLQPYLASYGLPALAAAVARGGDVIAAGAVGTRRWGTAAPVGLDDRFHLGSDTKPMTALLAAMLVEQGKLRWDSTVGEVFPELAGRMDPGLAKVTLTQLLSHSSGVPSDDQAFEDAVKRSETQDGNLDELRYWLLREWCPQKLVSTPGTTYAYANMNYVIVGAMIERISGRTWDELMVEKIFTPLHLRSAGLGNQASLGRVDAPLGHDPANGTPKPMLSGPERRQSARHRPGGDRAHVRHGLRPMGGLERGGGRAPAGAGDPGDDAQAPHRAHPHPRADGAQGRHPVGRQIRVRLGRGVGRVGAPAAHL